MYIYIYIYMDPRKMPFNALIVGPTNSGKTQYILNQLRGPRFHRASLPNLCFRQNLRLLRGQRATHLRYQLSATRGGSLPHYCWFFFEKTNRLIILDDCAASKDVKGRTSQLVNLGFSARHSDLSVWVLTQQMASIAKPFQENLAAIVLFYSPSCKTTKAIFEDYAEELSHEEDKGLVAQLKGRKYSHLVFSLRYPYVIVLSGRNAPYFCSPYPSTSPLLTRYTTIIGFII